MISLAECNKAPGERIGHIAAEYDGLMLIWGGYHGFNEDDQTNYLDSKQLWIYDSFEEKWFRKDCSAESDSSDIPPGTSGACCSVIGDFLYVFGGYNQDGNSKKLYRLNLNTLQWKLLEPSGMTPIPCDKSACWEYNNKLYIFAGYGCVPTTTNEDNYQFVLDANSHWHYRRGWNNQFICYDPDKNEWSWPRYRGKLPLARAAHAAAKIGSKVFIHGGRHGQTRMSDLCYIDMDEMKWMTQIVTFSQKNGQIPSGRSWHSLTSISDESIVLYGGFSQQNRPLNDCWMFHVPTLSWTQIQLPFNKPRLWHTATPSGFGEILVFGGGTHNILNYSIKNVYSGDIITLRFSPKSLLRLTLDAAINFSQLEKQWSCLPVTMQKLLNKRKKSSDVNSEGS